MLIFDNLHGYIEISDIAKNYRFAWISKIKEYSSNYLAYSCSFKIWTFDWYILSNSEMLNKINVKQQIRTAMNNKLVKLGGLCHDSLYSHAFDI